MSFNLKISLSSISINNFTYSTFYYIVCLSNKFIIVQHTLINKKLYFNYTKKKVIL